MHHECAVGQLGKRCIVEAARRCSENHPLGVKLSVDGVRSDLIRVKLTPQRA